jgi:hypothetical protein
MTNAGHETGISSYDGGKAYTTHDENSFSLTAALDDSKDQFSDVSFVNHELSRLCSSEDSDPLKIQKLMKISQHLVQNQKQL